jgi:hypothetical protein
MFCPPNWIRFTADSVLNFECLIDHSADYCTPITHVRVRTRNQNRQRQMDDLDRRKRDSGPMGSYFTNLFDGVPQLG